MSLYRLIPNSILKHTSLCSQQCVSNTLCFSRFVLSHLGFCIISLCLWAGLLSSCSFAPVNSDKTWQQIAKETGLYVTGDTRLARELKEMLSGKLNYEKPEQKAKYNLEVNVTRAVTDFALTRHSFATRSNVSVIANYKITEISTGKILDSGSVSDSSSFNVSSTSEYSNYVSKQYSATNSIKIVGDEIILRLFAASIFYKTTKEENAN